MSADLLHYFVVQAAAAAAAAAAETEGFHLRTVSDLSPHRRRQSI